MISAQQTGILKAQIERISKDRLWYQAMCLFCVLAFQFVCPDTVVTCIALLGLGLDLAGIPLERRLMAGRSYFDYKWYCVLQGVSTSLIVIPFALRISNDSVAVAMVAQATIWVLLMNCLVRRSGKVYLMIACSVPIGLGLLAVYIMWTARAGSLGGSTILVLVCVTMFIYAVGLIWQAMLQATDQVTDRLRADRAAEAKSRFFTTVNHEIRTPLNGILGMAQIIQSEAQTPEQIERARSLVESSKMLKALTDDLLDHAKLRAGQFTIKPEMINLPDLIDDSLRLYRDLAQERGLALSARIGPDVPTTIEADPVRLRQVLCNLIHNALKHTSEGSVQVTVGRTSRKGAPWIEISVVDTGAGIPQDRRDAIFAPFEQLDDAASRSGQGTGLGLAIARDLTTAMKGEITLTSDLGVGSSFCVALPAPRLAVVDRARSSERCWDGDALEGCRVLVVDDSRINRLVARSFLERECAEVTEAEDGRKALAALRDQMVDVVLMDLNMPHMDGAETLQRIQSDYGVAGPKVILLSASDGADQGDFDAILSKPLEWKSLIAAIHDTLSDRFETGLRDAS